MTIKHSSPTPQQIAEHPREFGLYAQAIHGKGTVNAKELHDLATKYGNPEKVKAVDEADGEVDFQLIIDALKAPPSKGFDGVAVKSDFPDGSGTVGYAADSGSDDLKPFKFARRPLKPADVRIQIAYCGVCHSDLHQAKDEWNNTVFPCLPGHEITGIITDTGADVKKFKVGDRAAIGCMVGSCRSCDECNNHDEQFCKSCVYTYNGKEIGLENPGSKDIRTKGGYSDHVVVDEHFVVHVPDNLDMAGTAPLLCAGITVYEPLVHNGLDKPGMKLGVVGLGGLGHAAVLIGTAMGLDVTVISTTESKREEATKVLGAQHFVVAKDEAAMKEVAGTLHGIIDTVSAPHPLTPALELLRGDGKYVVVGVPTEPLELENAALIFGRKLIVGSLIGGMKSTQEMLEFCGKHNLTAIIETIPISKINEAYERMLKSDVKYRFVIDIQGSLVQ